MEQHPAVLTNLSRAGGAEPIRGDLPAVREEWSFSYTGISGAGLIVPEFIPAEAARSITDKLRGQNLIEYYQGDNKAGDQVSKGKYGPNYFRFKDQPQEYFSRVEQVAQQFSELINVAEIDVFSKVQQAFGAFLGIDRMQVAHGFIPYTIRDFPGAVPPHSDWLVRDCPEVTFARAITSQFAWNIYLHMPAEGGELRVYNRDSRERKTFDPLATQFVDIRPQAGDLVVFESTNIHEVLAGPQPASRLTLSGFAGVAANRNLIFFV